jgi:hypothetical protein
MFWSVSHLTPQQRRVLAFAPSAGVWHYILRTQTWYLIPPPIGFGPNLSGSFISRLPSNKTPILFSPPWSNVLDHYFSCAARVVPGPTRFSMPRDCLIAPFRQYLHPCIHTTALPSRLVRSTGLLSPRGKHTVLHAPTFCFVPTFEVICIPRACTVWQINWGHGSKCLPSTRAELLALCR